jgi:hypothetical protein
MSVSKDPTVTIDDGGAFLSSTFLDFCVKVRNNDPSILPAVGRPFKIIELADALLENSSATYLALMRSSAEAMAKYVRTSNRLQHIHWRGEVGAVYRHPAEMLCCFLTAIQESTSLKELNMESPRGGGPLNLALENMLTHTQSLRSLRLFCSVGPLEDAAVAAARSEKKNTTLR